ncbi:hypothetical protein FGRMN_9316 [Fusarium graminum]|nr:hypothetical protein FGRMN_9316 [Fusarium graminum]
MASPGRPPGYHGTPGSDKKIPNLQQDSPSGPPSGRGAPPIEQRVPSGPPPFGGRGISPSGRGAPPVQRQLHFGPPSAQGRGNPSIQPLSFQQQFPSEPVPPWGRGSPSSGRVIPVQQQRIPAGPSPNIGVPSGRPRAQTSGNQPLPPSQSGSPAQQANIQPRGSTSSRGAHTPASRGRGTPSSSRQQQSTPSFSGNRTPSSGSLAANNPGSPGPSLMSRASPSSGIGATPTRPQGSASQPQGYRTSSQGSPYLPPRPLKQTSTPGPSGSRTSSHGSSFTPIRNPSNPTTGSSPDIFSGSPGSIANLPSRSPASTSTSQVAPGAPPTKPRTILFKTFRVIRALSPGDVKNVEQVTGLRGFIAVEAGVFGTLPNIEANFDRNGSVVPYPLARLLRQTQ